MAASSLVVPWFALGFGLYAVAYATAGALASRQQSPDTAGQPVTYTLVAAYLASYAAVSANSSSLLANVLTVFPLTAPLVLPARSALVGVPLWDTRSRSCSCSHRSTRSSDSPGARMPKAFCTPAPASARARPGASPASHETHSAAIAGADGPLSFAVMAALPPTHAQDQMTARDPKRAG